MARALVAASPYADKREIAWFREASAKEANFDSLEYSGGSRFAILDGILAQTLI